MEKDDIDEGNIVLSLKLDDVFQDGGDTLKKIINKDVVTPDIQESPDSDHHRNLKSLIPKNKANTFTSLFEIVQPSKGKQNIIKVDMNILQSLIKAYRAGCEVNLESTTQHELMAVPLSLATRSGSLHSTNKVELANILT